jgi:hypothetical protein
VDPVSLASSVVTFLCPYLIKAGEKSAEKVGEQLPIAVGKVWNAIFSRLKDRPYVISGVAWRGQPGGNWTLGNRKRVYRSSNMESVPCFTRVWTTLLKAEKALAPASFLEQ